MAFGENGIGYWRAGLCLGLLGLAGGCAHAPLNAPLSVTSERPGYTFHAHQPKQDDGVVVALFFSGGGSRAAAFSYGVMQELARTPLPGNHRLLDDVAVINAVSGGAFPASYYCLYGDRLFTDFEREFLRINVEGPLLRNALVPFLNVALWSRDYARSDMAADIYDARLFHGATFADLIKKGAEGLPFLVINATNVMTGDSFPFTQEAFDLIGSDLSTYRISRAVAASSAVPLLLTPIVLRNYGNVTATQESIPSFGPAGQSDRGGPARVLRHLITTREQRLHDTKSFPYLYLMDGGLSDNLGLVNLLAIVAKAGGWGNILKDFAAVGKRRLVIVVVDSANKVSETWVEDGRTPSSGSLLRVLVNVSMSRRNEDIETFLRASLEEWREQNKTLALPISVDLITIGFNQEADAQKRTYLQHIPTRFYLTAEQVDRLVRAGGDLLRENPDFKRLLVEESGR